MRLGSHIIAVFVAISTLVSPCLASIKASQAADTHSEKTPDFITQAGQPRHSATVEIADIAKDVCNGPCAKLLTARNIQPLRSNIDSEFTGIMPVNLIVQEKSTFFPTTTTRLASLTQWNSVDIYSLCRQLN